VYLHGAHLTSWRTADGRERLFLSDTAAFAPPKAIRGGVPICFPQFGNFGPCPAQHGFARNRAFAVEAATSDSATLLLEYPGDEPSYPCPFALRVGLQLAPGALRQTLTATNTGASPLPPRGPLSPPPRRRC
jgi:glucose-6-phosphate 1-epimerase